MDVIDPADQSSWPTDVVAEVEKLAARCRKANNPPGTPSYELSLEHVDAAHEADLRFRELLGPRPVALFHATRLLPHELESLRTEGLVVLDEGHRSRRVDRVIEIYGAEVGTERLENLRAAGPLTWDQGHRRGRLGKLAGVTPLQVAFDEAGKGMTVFLTHWGGESFYWARNESPDHKTTIGLLTARSAAVIVEVGVRATALCTFKKLWPVFVGQLDHWSHPWNEFFTRESVPAERVIAVLGPRSERWPLASGVL